MPFLYLFSLDRYYEEINGEQPPRAGHDRSRILPSVAAGACERVSAAQVSSLSAVSARRAGKCTGRVNVTDRGARESRNSRESDGRASAVWLWMTRKKCRAARRFFNNSASRGLRSWPDLVKKTSTRLTY